MDWGRPRWPFGQDQACKVAAGSGWAGVGSETGFGAWQVPGESGYTGVALEARAGQNSHVWTSWGRPVKV